MWQLEANLHTIYGCISIDTVRIPDISKFFHYKFNEFIVNDFVLGALSRKEVTMK